MKKKILLNTILLLFTLILILNINRIKFLWSFIDINGENSTIKADFKEDSQIVENNPLKELIKKETEDEEAEEDLEINSIDDIKDNTNYPNTEKTITKKPTSPPDKNKILEDKSKSFNSIAIKYNGKFESLQNEFMNSLNDLIQKGYSEYQSGDLSKSKLASKYLDLGSSLEKSSDKRFFSLIDEMKTELRENGHPIDITKEIENYYKSFKGGEKKKLLSKMKGYI